MPDTDPYEDPDDEAEGNSSGFDPYPWEATQFKPGESRGRGRPKGARGVKKVVEEVFLERHEVKEDGTTKSLTALEIIIKVLRNGSLASDRAYSVVQDLIDRHSPNSREPRPILAWFPERLSIDLWVKRYGPKAEPIDCPVEGAATEQAAKL